MSDDNLLERAKALRETALPRRICSIPGQTGYGNPSLNKGWDFSAVDELVRVVVPELITEVERLRSEIKNMERTIRNYCTEIRQLHKHAKSQADIDNDLFEDQANQIEALKDALVEERARRICHIPREDKVGHWPRYEDVVVKEARQQLKAEMPGVEWK